MKKTLLLITLCFIALVMTGCMDTINVSVDTPFDEIRRPTDRLCVGEEEVEREGKVGRQELTVIAYDDQGNQFRPGQPIELTKEQEEALAATNVGEVTAGDKRFIVRHRKIRLLPEDKILLIGTSNESPPCEPQSDDRTFPSLINEIGLEIYPGEKQTGPNDYIDEPTTAVLVIKIDGSEETAFQAIQDDLEDIGAKDIQRTDGADGAGYKIRIEATLEEKKIDVLLMSSEAGTFAVYSVGAEK